MLSVPASHPGVSYGPTESLEAGSIVLERTLPNLQFFWEWSLGRRCGLSREMSLLGAAVLPPLVSLQTPGVIDFAIRASKSGCIKFIAVDMTSRGEEDGFPDLAAKCCMDVWWAGGHYSLEAMPSSISARFKALSSTTRPCHVNMSTSVQISPSWTTSFAPLAEGWKNLCGRVCRTCTPCYF